MAMCLMFCQAGRPLGLIEAKGALEERLFNNGAVRMLIPAVLVDPPDYESAKPPIYELAFRTARLTSSGVYGPLSVRAIQPTNYATNLYVVRAFEPTWDGDQASSDRLRTLRDVFRGYE